jgi:hypothetical protein
MPPNHPNIHSDFYGLYWGYIITTDLYTSHYFSSECHTDGDLYRDLIYQYHEFG